MRVQKPMVEASRTLSAHVRREKNGAFGRQQEHGLPIRERWLPGGLNQLVRAGDVKSRQVLCFGLFSSVFKAERNIPPPVPQQGLYDFGEADVTLSQHEEDVSAFAEKLWNMRDAGKRTVFPFLFCCWCLCTRAG